MQLHCKFATTFLTPALIAFDVTCTPWWTPLWTVPTEVLQFQAVTWYNHCEQQCLHSLNTGQQKVDLQHPPMEVFGFIA